MKYSTLQKLFGASALAVSLSVLPTVLPASAQEAPTDTTPTQETAADRDFDWGWLGLLGLIGLAGLARKNDDNVRYREPDEVHRSSTRY
jgi:MYXO-CTERM domain-containing protein